MTTKQRHFSCPPEFRPEIRRAFVLRLERLAEEVRACQRIAGELQIDGVGVGLGILAVSVDTATDVVRRLP